MLVFNATPARRILVVALVFVVVPAFVILFSVSAIGWRGVISIVDGPVGLVWSVILLGVVAVLAGITLYNTRLRKKS